MGTGAGKGSAIRKLVNWEKYFTNLSELNINKEDVGKKVKKVLKRGNRSIYIY